MARQTRQLRYVPGDQVAADQLSMSQLPLKAEGESRAIGKVVGAVVDTESRQMAYLVVDTRAGKKLMPLGGTWLKPTEPALHVLSSREVEECDRFDPSAFGTYDDDAMLALLFGSAA